MLKRTQRDAFLRQSNFFEMSTLSLDSEINNTIFKGARSLFLYLFLDEAELVQKNLIRLQCHEKMLGIVSRFRF